MKISIIIPAYNARKTIEATLRSLTTQSHSDSEILLIDDGSSDGTADFVRKQFPHVHVIEQANAGPAAARNRGTREARGEWIAFLDADDAWLPWRLELQVDCLNRHPECGMLCGKTTDLECEVALPPKDAAAREQLVRPLKLEDFAFANPVATSTVLLRREILESVGGFDESFRGPEDYDLWIRVANATPILSIDYPISRYRDEAGSLSRSHRSFLPEVLRVVDKAHSTGGALAKLKCKRRARAVQFVGAAWMAAEANERFAALALLLRSFAAYPEPLRIVGKSPCLRAGLLLKCLKGGES